MEHTHLISVCVFCLLCATHIHCSEYSSKLAKTKIKSKEESSDWNLLKHIRPVRSELSKEEATSDYEIVSDVRNKRSVKNSVPVIDEQVYIEYLFQKYKNSENKIDLKGFKRMLQNLGLKKFLSHDHNRKSDDVEEKSEKIESQKFQYRSEEYTLNSNSNHVSNNSAAVQECFSPDKLLRILVKGQAQPADLSTNTLAEKSKTNSDNLEITVHSYGRHPSLNSSDLYLSKDGLVKICPMLLYHVVEPNSCHERHERSSHHHEKGGWMPWLYASASVVVISLCGLLGVFVIPIMGNAFYQQLLQFLVALAVGTLCGDALLHLLPHAMIPHNDNHDDDNDHGHNATMWKGLAVMMGLVVFFFTEKLLMLGSDLRKKHHTVIIREHEVNHHGHSHTHGHVHSPPDTLSSVAWMVVLGDGFHNFTDGMAIGAAFSNNIAGGCSTAVAVFCHELPHEFGDFAVLLKAGMSAKKAVFYNLISSILCYAGMCLGIMIGDNPQATSWVFAVAAGMFLYIGLVDMFPELTSSHSSKKSSLCQFSLQGLGLLTGVGIMLLIAYYEDHLLNLFK